MDEALRKGIELFNKREFFECHEVLEAAWTTEQNPRRLFLQGLIHAAVGCYHYQRGNSVGAGRQLSKALRKLSGFLPECEGIDTARLDRDTRSMLDELTRDPAAEIQFPRIELAGPR